MINDIFFYKIESSFIDLCCLFFIYLGYLSWCRNFYLMIGVGVGMLYKGYSVVVELVGYCK